MVPKCGEERQQRMLQSSRPIVVVAGRLITTTDALVEAIAMYKKRIKEENSIERCINRARMRPELGGSETGSGREVD